MQIFFIAVLGAIGFLVVILAIYIGGNWLLSRLRKAKPPSKESVRRYRERLLTPRWEELEMYLDQPIPAEIKGLYAQTQIICRQDFEFTANGTTYHLDHFLPADIEALDEIWPNLKDSGVFPLATDLFGDCYYSPLAEDESGLRPVMLYRHDGNDFELVCKSLDEFLNRIREGS